MMHVQVNLVYVNVCSMQRGTLILHRAKCKKNSTEEKVNLELSEKLFGSKEDSARDVSLADTPPPPLLLTALAA